MADTGFGGWITGGIATFYGYAPACTQAHITPHTARTGVRLMAWTPTAPRLAPSTYVFFSRPPEVRPSNSCQHTPTQGACGFGTLDKNSWPGWNVAGIATSNRFYSKLPGNACGACFEIQCVDPREGACNPARKTVTVVCVAWYSHSGIVPITYNMGTSTPPCAQTVTDECPECGADHWDIQALTFAQVSIMETATATSH